MSWCHIGRSGGKRTALHEKLLAESETVTSDKAVLENIYVIKIHLQNNFIPLWSCCLVPLIRYWSIAQY